MDLSTCTISMKSPTHWVRNWCMVDRTQQLAWIQTFSNSMVYGPLPSMTKNVVGRVLLLSTWYSLHRSHLASLARGRSASLYSFLGGLLYLVHLSTAINLIPCSQQYWKNRQVQCGSNSSSWALRSSLCRFLVYLPIRADDPPIMLIWNGWPSTFIGFFWSVNLIWPSSIAEWICRLDTLHSLGCCEGELCQLHHLFLFSFSRDDMTWFGGNWIYFSSRSKLNILLALLMSKLNFLIDLVLHPCTQHSLLAPGPLGQTDFILVIRIWRVLAPILLSRYLLN